MYVLVFTTNAVLSIVVVMELGYDDDGCARIWYLCICATSTISHFWFVVCNTPELVTSLTLQKKKKKTNRHVSQPGKENKRKMIIIIIKQGSSVKKPAIDYYLYKLYFSSGSVYYFLSAFHNFTFITPILLTPCHRAWFYPFALGYLGGQFHVVVVVVLRVQLKRKPQKDPSPELSFLIF